MLNPIWKIFISLFLTSSFLYAAEKPVLLDQEPIKPIFKDPSLNKAKVLLGEKLFFDTRLSADNSVSCGHCHRLVLGGADAQQFATGIKGQKGDVNSPTVFNARYNIAQFWDGRADSLEKQALGPVENPIEMGSTWPDVVNKLNQEQDLKQQFYRIYGQEISAATVTDAIAEFERSLVTINAPFDLYLLGNEKAISEQAKQGYALFKSYGCISCHHGINVGGNMFHKMGALKAYFSPKDEEFLLRDLGRYNVTKDPMDKYVFKVPSLRTVTQTAPYFHDGSIKTLSEAITAMARYQLLREIPDDEVELMIAFLESLSGEYDRIEP